MRQIQPQKLNRAHPFAILIALVLLPCAGALAADYPDPSRWDYTMVGFKLADEIDDIQPGGIVLTGSSSMRFWGSRIHQDLAPLKVVSRGFGGSNMNDVFHHIDTLVLKHKPRAVVIYEGDNDIAQDVPVDVVVAKFRQSIDKIHAELPKTRVYLVSVKPSVSRATLWDDMTRVNVGLQKMATRDALITYIDVGASMFEANGEMRTDIYIEDKLHLNQKGYDIWSDAISEVLLTNEVQYEFPRIR
jgi:lysophospholipase L1-like esterase